ncbi:MAG: PilZ domain-containing protein [Chitinivibrionales bacterium]|nr:PilZ domain-containing protein [Chitinivibrionales bacterium]
MRQYIRHPSDIPIEYSVPNSTAQNKKPLKNISKGGICFIADDSMTPGSPIKIRFPHIGNRYEADGKVVWCRECNDNCEVGVAFSDESTNFCVRMVEQICHIEHYRKEVLQKNGRRLSGEQAAAEWIEKHAESFPQ